MAARPIARALLRQTMTPTPITFQDSIDARVWVEKWLVALASNPDLPRDPDTMTGWFANAIMAGYEHACLIKDQQFHRILQDIKISFHPFHGQTTCIPQLIPVSHHPVLYQDPPDP